jgi:hypothetical protein
MNQTSSRERSILVSLLVKGPADLRRVQKELKGILLLVIKLIVSKLQPHCDYLAILLLSFDNFHSFQSIPKCHEREKASL